MDEIAQCATIWAGIRRVEAVWCVVPGISGVLDGFHEVRADSVDGHRIAILVDTDSARDAYDSPVILTQLAYLGEVLVEERHREMVAGPAGPID